MVKTFRWAFVSVLSVAVGLGSVTVARASISNSSGTNVQQGDNRDTSGQGGSSGSGDAVGGQVVGVVSSGRTSVDAKNVSKDSSVDSGDAHATNTRSAISGLVSSNTTTVGTADISNVSFATNLQEGDNRSTSTQTANATTGDGVAGQVIGAVTSAGGSSSIVAANRSENVDVHTGDAHATNDASSFTGLNASDEALTVAADLNSVCTGSDCSNVQEGRNRTTSRQSSTAATGDGVAGQVIGAVSAGASSIDANNVSTDSSVDTGKADASNDLASFVGQNTGGPATITAVDVTNSCNVGQACDNLQQGDNRATFNQSASSKSGDGVAGEVIGAVTSAGGSSSIVAANTTKDSDVQTGDATSTNDQAAFVGLNEGGGDLGVQITADIAGSCRNSGCESVQEGDNRLTSSQTATSSTGDGVAGQVLGVVSAGRASLDATNRSDGNSVDTGDSHATNHASAFVGIADSDTVTVGTGDISGARADNLQEGDNRKTLSQSANAISGDAIAGQVGGVVTSAGGSASVVLDNTSTNIDSTSGSSHFDNADAGFVGLLEGQNVTIL